MAKRWRIRPHDAARIASLERAARVPPVVAQLLLLRGIHDVGDARVFLESKLTDLRDPDTLPGVTSAARILHDAATRPRPVVVYGDYDCDGMTAAAILYRCLQLIGADVRYYVPNRLEEGYGLNSEAIEKLANRGAEVIVSVDCGIRSVEVAQTARRLGVDLIITDHHEMGPSLPDAAAIVHPRLPGSAYPFGGLCGAGVALKLAWSICRLASGSDRVTPRLRQFLLSALGLAAVGTVADVVPLVDENRLIVLHGLACLQHHPVEGIAALMRQCKLDGKSCLVSEDIAFGLGPRLNAAGRLGQALLGVELLTSESSERCHALASYVDQLNQNRDSLERSVYKAAHQQLKEQFDPQADPALVLAGTDWHPGVIGIVAGRLAEKYHRPVIVISVDPLATRPGSGSGRSACGLNLHQALESCGDCLQAFGGHAAAAGLTIDPARIDEFRASFCEQVEAMVTPEERVAELWIDAEAPLSQMTWQTVRQIERLAPFGEGNPRPLLCASGVQLDGPPKRMGGGDRHLSLRLKQHSTSLRAVAFQRGEWADELVDYNSGLDVAFRPVINEFRGYQRVELHLVDWRHTSDEGAAPLHLS